MEKILFKIHENNTSQFDQETHGYTTIPLRSLNEIFSTNYFNTTTKSVILYVIDSREELEKALLNPSLKKISIPIVFKLKSPSERCIKNLLHVDYTHFFTADQPQFLLENYINYIFDNYTLFKVQKSNTILNGLDQKILTKKEMEIIRTLAESPIQELHRDQIYLNIWGSNELNTNTLDVHLCNLRRKLKTTQIRLQNTENGKVKITQVIS